MRTRIRAGSVALVGIFLVLSVTGCHTLNPTTPLAVHVQDAETHAPVPGAAVRLWRFGSHRDERDEAVPSGSDGIARARVAPPDEGGVMIEVTAPGYLSVQGPLPKDVSDALATAKPLHPYKGPPLAITMELFAGPRPVAEVIVPVGYRGLLKAEVRARTDGPWPPGQRLFSYTLPANGVLRIEGPAVFGLPGGPEIIAKYPDGTVVPKEATNGEVALRFIRRDGTDVYFAVGSLGDADMVRRSLGAMGNSGLEAKDPDDNKQSSGRGGRGGGGGGRGGGMGGRMGGMGR